MTTLKAKLIGYTQPDMSFKGSSPEDILGYCARVSNPANQEKFDTQQKLFAYCMKHKHWSIFEMVSATVEVEAPRDISRQLLRHRSFSFQEFSQRYATPSSGQGGSPGTDLPLYEREYRLQDKTNRQNSIPATEEDLDFEECDYYVDKVCEAVRDAYDVLIDSGVAKECARVILPEGLTMSRLYVNGTLRSWLHYLDVRDDPGVTQWEHVVLAREIRKVLEPVFPNIIKPEVDYED